MVTINNFELKQQIIEAGEIAVLAMVKMVYPAKDEISNREACKTYGEAWIKFHLNAGNLKTHRRGQAVNSKKYFSRMDICALKKAETIYAKLR